MTGKNLSVEKKKKLGASFKMRPCISCRNKFLSTDNGNHMCNTCRTKSLDSFSTPHSVYI